MLRKERGKREIEMTLKTKRCLPLVITLIAFLSILAITLGNQPIVAYFFN